MSASLKGQWKSGLFLIGALLLFAGELLLPGRVFYRWDTVVYLWPLLKEAGEQWMAGQAPFWMSSVACGTPLLANINLGLMYPLRWLHWIGPFEFGYNIFVFAQCGLSAMFMALYLQRGLRVGPAAALTGALIYTFSGYARGMWDTHNLTVFPWIPLLLLGLEWTGRKKLRVGWAACLAAWILMLLGGDTQQVLLAGGAAGLYGLLHPQRGRMLRAVTGSGLIALCLTAPQWIPAWATLAESYRAGGLPYEEAVERSLHPLRMLTFWIPHLFGTHGDWQAPFLFGAGATRLSPWSASHHTSLLGWGFALFAVFRLRRPECIWAAMVCTAAVLLSFGRFLPGFEWIHQLPLMSGFRFPEKYLFWMPVAVAIAAALGMDHWLGKPDCPVHIRTAGLVTVALLAVLGFFAASGEVPRMDLALRIKWFGILGVSSLIPFFPSFRKVLPILLPVLIVVQLWIPWRMEQPLSRHIEYETPPPIAREILQRNPAGRFFYDPVPASVPMPGYWNELTSESERKAVHFFSTLSFNAPAWWGLRTADGFSPLEDEDMHVFRMEQGRSLRNGARDPSELADFLTKTGTQWLFTNSDRWERLRNHGVQGEAVAVWTGEPSPGMLLKLGSAQETDPPDVLLQRRSAHQLSVELPSEFWTGSVRIAETASSGWSLEAGSASWRVGRDWDGFLQVQRSNESTPGVELRYVPPGWSWGWLLHGIGWGLIGAVWKLYLRPARGAA